MPPMDVACADPPANHGGTLATSTYHRMPCAIRQSPRIAWEAARHRWLVHVRRTSQSARSLVRRRRSRDALGLLDAGIVGFHSGISGGIGRGFLLTWRRALATKERALLGEQAGGVPVRALALRF